MKRKLYTAFALAVIFAMAMTSLALAAVWTDKPDYSPGEVVTISGDNSDGAGFLAGETVHVDVLGPNGYVSACDATADDNGAWFCQVTLWNTLDAVGTYLYTATGQISGVSQDGTFTDQMQGAIYTTDNNCTVVNGNLFPAKTDVYLDGGPKGGGQGLPPGNYFVQVTNPNGNVVLGKSLDPVVTVNINGEIVGCLQLSSIVLSASSSFLTAGYDDTPNNGDEYKVWVSTVSTFDPNSSKTDNFKVGEEEENPASNDLTVTKTATPTFKRTYNWDISKDVTPKLVEQFGGTATFNYTVKAWQTGFTDSDWAVAGTITVTNPNDWEAITLTSLSDAVDVNTCTVDAGPYVVPVSGSIEVNYTCTFAAKPAYNTDLTNIATATWASATYFTPTGSASGEAKFQFTTPTTSVNKTITVTDTFNGTTSTLGTLTARDGIPYASATFTYSRTVNVPTWNCVFYTNEAKIVETSQSASQTVEVCGPAKTGALTMGFWQNRNGQGIIKTGASTGGVCNSGTWLRQYAPFQDLSATATCSQVATYIYNVIKAANASGSSMNAMLKAQMLATALDVYFFNIGGYSVDLTMICTDMTCTAFEDSSSVFGGTPKTILEMLSYAASQSNVGGSLWYGQVKATQELAKDAFDAINNQKVFAP